MGKPRYRVNNLPKPVIKVLSIAMVLIQLTLISSKLEATQSYSPQDKQNIISIKHQTAKEDMSSELGDDSQPAANNQQQQRVTPDTNSLYIDQHKSRLRAMHDLFERRFLSGPQQTMTASQELSPISMGIDPVSGMASPFQMSPFQGVVPNQPPDHSQPVGPVPKPPLANAEQGMGPSLPFPLGQLPQLLGFHNQPFDGPQRGDQSAHSNFHTPMPSAVESEQQGSGLVKTWPKIFRFTDGRINLSDFEKQKKIRLSAKNHETDNHIESAPIMFDGRQLKRKSFLILHGGIFSK